MLGEFTHIQRFWDHTHGIEAARVQPGEYYVTELDQAIVTILGSCVSACVRDPLAGIGGLNHFLLPVEPDGGSPHQASTRYGVHAMEMLINELLKRGARRSRMEVKISGGGHVLIGADGIKVGERNIEFVKWYLQSEGLNLVAEDVGGHWARKVFFFPQTGRMRVRKMNSHQAPASAEEKYMRTLKQRPVAGEVELF
ncbi:MAG: chemoreceptor glutamine deamidase CheD [Bradymonadia bacterium]